MSAEYFEIECKDNCRCLVEGMDGLERVLEIWHPKFISVRRVRLTVIEVIERTNEICDRRGELPCKRMSGG